MGGFLPLEPTFPGQSGPPPHPPSVRGQPLSPALSPLREREPRILWRLLVQWSVSPLLRSATLLGWAGHRWAGRAIAALGLLASCTTACGPASDLQSGLTTCAADFGTALAACQRLVQATVGCKPAAQRVVRALGTCRKAAQRLVRATVGCKPAAQRVVQAQITCRQPAQRLVRYFAGACGACVRC